MSFRRSVLLASLLAALVPGSALAADGSIVSREIPVGQADGARRSLPARPAPVAFEMVGLHWRGSGDVWFRTARERGAWSVWRHARPESEDQPDRASPEADREAGWKLGNPYWTGPSRFIQYRLAGRVTRLRAFFLQIPASEPPRALAARTGRPAIVRRPQWGANESIVRGTPAYADRVRLSVVHHTAGTNRYSRAQAAGIVRGIQRYHVQGNGWNDIGYNFLVDKYGRIYEGRAGGIARNVIGAHAQGFNTGSVGVAVLGDYGSTTISRAARRALQRLLAWRLDLAHVHPRSTVTVTSLGNPRFPAGRKVRLRTVSGHRDTGYTTCPGGDLYGRLGGIARATVAIGLPKLYEAEVAGAVGGPVHFTARLSSPRRWTVTVRNGSGAVVARGQGLGTTIDWTWDSSSAPLESYTYLMNADGVRSALGTVPGPPPLDVTRLEAAPAVITPNGDGKRDRTRISFTLSRRAVMRVTVLRGGGVRAKTLVDDEERVAGRISVVWDGTDDAGEQVPDQRYRVRVAAVSGSEQVVRYRGVTVDATLGKLAALPAVFSPNRDGRRERIRFSYSLTRPADMRLKILRGGRVLGTVARASAVPAGQHELAWDGTLRGASVAHGRYKVSVQATTALGTRTLSRRFRVDTVRPRVGIVRVWFARRATRLRFTLSERGRPRIWYGHRSWDDGDSRRLLERPPGEQLYRRRGRFRLVRIVVRDVAGNRSRADTALVRL